MLGRKNKGSSEGFGGFLGEGTEIDGDVRFNDELRVDGKVGGRVISERGRLVVGESGEVNADVYVGIASIGGTVSGTITASVKVELHSTGRFYGSIHAPALIIEEGAVFEGHCDMNASAPSNVESIADREETSETPRMERAAG
jgi:cytoskeletal protein CcmA (bactofilin family)